MHPEEFHRQLELVFTDLVNRCATDFTKDDLNKVIPLLTVLSDKDNYEASLILALYFDPNGCLFPAINSHDQEKSLEMAIKFYQRAYDASKNDKSPRGLEVFRFLGSILKTV